MAFAVRINMSLHKLIRSNRRQFSSYIGKEVRSEDLIKKDDSWVIEETNFCLGKVAVSLIVI